MVLLLMTPAMVVAVDNYKGIKGNGPSHDIAIEAELPPLNEAKEGNLISHFQLVEISQTLLNQGNGLLSDHEMEAFRLNSLLRGAKFYVPSPKPSPAKTPEYEALMARLRAAQEAQTYSQMTKSAPQAETFYQRFPYAQRIQLRNDGTSDEDDELTFADINRQVTLIFNILVSVVACAVALWLVARRWSTPSRLFLSLGSSVIVAVAEVGVYMGYIRRIGEAKLDEKKRSKHEEKSIVDTWVIEGKKASAQLTTIGPVLGADPKDKVRLRRKKVSEDKT